MTNIQTKRIYDPAATTDGFRILVDRLWPRGVKRDEAKLDLWAKDITPTTELRKAYHEGSIAWPEFEALYHAQLCKNPALDDFVKTVRNKETVTLLFAGKDTAHTHVKVIVDVLRQHLSDLAREQPVPLTK